MSWFSLSTFSCIFVFWLRLAARNLNANPHLFFILLLLFHVSLACFCLCLHIDLCLVSLCSLSCMSKLKFHTFALHSCVAPYSRPQHQQLHQPLLLLVLHVWHTFISHISTSYLLLCLLPLCHVCLSCTLQWTTTSTVISIFTTGLHVCHTFNVLLCLMLLSCMLVRHLTTNLYTNSYLFCVFIVLSSFTFQPGVHNLIPLSCIFVLHLTS